MTYPESVSFGSIMTVISNQCSPTILFYPADKPLKDDTSLRTHLHVIPCFFRLAQSSKIKTPALASEYRARGLLHT